VADTRTTVTELATGLGMLDFASVEEALTAEPRQMVSVSPELWAKLRSLHSGGLLRAEFNAAFNNGAAFLRATDALRGRVPEMVEWKGATKAPGDEVVPADLRVDHVYVVSCKYLSKIVTNASPSYVFDRLLVGGQGQRSVDWYREVAPAELDSLYRSARKAVGLGQDADRRLVTQHLRGRWPSEMREEARDFASLVAERTADRWQQSIDAGAGAGSERMLLRLLRIGSAPYFVLGTDKTAAVRLRIETPWDWKQRNRLKAFDLLPRVSDQPVIDWIAEIQNTRSGALTTVAGHVEIRWSHGKFNGAPEAKVYLDTPHHRVPGYVPLG